MTHSENAKISILVVFNQDEAVLENEETHTFKPG